MLVLKIVFYTGRTMLILKLVQTVRFQDGKVMSLKVNKVLILPPREKKKKAAKILRWFSLKPRLKRLFMSPETANHIKWHANGRVNDGLMRHPADSKDWKSFDSKYIEFSSRLGLVADRFNPYENMSTTHSTWLVILIPYNLPPWMCMKMSYFMLSLLIPSLTSFGNNIDVYLQPLVEELKEL